MKTKNRLAVLSAAAAVSIPLLAPPTVSAAVVTWNAATAKWESTTSWTGGSGSNPPASADDARVVNGGTVNYDATSGTRSIVNLTVGSNSNPNKGSGTLNISGGTLNVTGNIAMSDTGNNNGTITLSGGALNVTGNITNGGNGVATLTVSGGTLDATDGNIDVDAFTLSNGIIRNIATVTPTLTQSGGTLEVVAGDVASLGNYALNGGTTQFTGGSLAIQGSITTTSATSVLNLTGTALDMTSGTIGVGQLALRSGSIANVAAGGATLSSTGDALVLRNTSIGFAVGLTGATGGNIVFESAANGTGAISGNLNLGNQVRTINVQDGTAATDLNISGAISSTTPASGGVNKTNSGTLVFSGAAANTYTGLTTVSAGTLALNKTAGTNAVAGNLQIEAGATARLDASNQIADGSTVTAKGTGVGAIGTFDLNSQADTIGTLAVQGGSVIGGTVNVATDYTNANFGSGNSFLPKGTGTGATINAAINAVGNRDQTITGTGVQNGATNTPTFNIGNFRAGSNINASSNLGVTWGGDAAGPTLRGAVQTSGLSGGFSSTAGDFTLATNNSTYNHGINYVESNATAGQKTGGSVVVLNNFDDVRDQTVSVTANVFRYAVQNLNTTSASFNIVHVGDVVSAQNVTFGNIASTDGFSDNLGGAFGTPTNAGIVATGSANVAAGSTNTPGSMTLGINTASAGSRNGTVAVNFTSNPTVTGPDTAALTAGSVSVTGQVNAYAAASLAKDSGDGSLSGGGTTYNLDLGQINQGAGTLAQILAIANIGGGGASFTDLLDGSFDLTGGGSFNLSGFASFFTPGGITDGSNRNGLQVALNGNLTPGVYTGNFIFTPHGTNGSGYDQALSSGPITVNLTGEVLAVPEPTGALFALSLGGLALLGRRRRSR